MKERTPKEYANFLVNQGRILCPHLSKVGAKRIAMFALKRERELLADLPFVSQSLIYIIKEKLAYIDTTEKVIILL